MPKAILILLALSAAVASAPPATAEPADTVGQWATWAVHIDVQELVRSQFMLELASQAQRPDSPLPPATAGEILQGCRKLAAVQAITVYGPNRQESEAVALVTMQGPYDRQEIGQLLGVTDDQPVASHGRHAIQTFVSNAGSQNQKYLCFYNDRTLVAAHRLDRLKSAMDVLDGQGQPLSHASPLRIMLAPSPGSIVVAAADGVGTALDEVGGDVQMQAALLRGCRTLRIECGQSGENIRLTVQGRMSDVQQADLGKQTLQGLLALSLMQEQSEPILTELLQAVKVGGSGDLVTIALDYPAKPLAKRLAEMLQGRLGMAPLAGAGLGD